MSLQVPARQATVPSPADTSAATPPERRAPALVTRMVGIGLVVVAAGVVVSAMNGGDTPAPRARVAASTDPALVVTDAQPAVVRVSSVTRVGDAILLRVDPIGSQGARTLVASPGARVTTATGAMPLQQLLESAADSRSVVHDMQFRLDYDAIGQVVALAQTPPDDSA